MPKLHHVKARADIYQYGLTTKNDKNKSGQSIDRSKPANKSDKVIVKKGEMYYWWQFAYGSKNISLTKPKPAQLTQSAYFQAIYGIQEEIDSLSADHYCDSSELEEVRDNIKTQVEELKDETQEKLDNMPEGLQQGDTGQLLQERIDALQSAEDELDNVDCEYNGLGEDEVRVELAEEEDKEEDKIHQDAIDERMVEKFQEWAQGVIEEIQCISLEG